MYQINETHECYKTSRLFSSPLSPNLPLTAMGFVSLTGAPPAWSTEIAVSLPADTVAVIAAQYAARRDG